MISNWSYSTETPNLGQIRQILELCDLEIWRMTLKNNRAPLLCYLKLYVSFHHVWIQTGVTVRKLLSWVLTSVALTFDLWHWPFAWTLLRSLVITPENFMMIQWWEHSEKGVTDRRTDRCTDGQTENTIHRAAWSQLKMHLNMSSEKWSPFCLGLNVLPMTITKFYDWHMLNQLFSNNLFTIQIQWNRSNLTHRGLLWLHMATNIMVMTDPVTACHLFATKSLFEAMQIYCQLAPRNQIPWNMNWNIEVSIQANLFDNDIFKISSILSRDLVNYMEELISGMGHCNMGNWSVENTF